MSLDQSSNTENIDNIKETQSLKIEKLETKILNEYKISSKNLETLTTFSTSKSLEDLKGELKNTLNIRSENIEAAANDIVELQKLKEQSQEQINNLRVEIEKTTLEKIETFKYTSKIIPKSILDKVENPKNIGENLLGLSVGLTESALTIGVLAYETALGMIKTPIDLYNISTGKSEYKGFKEI